MVQTMVRMLLPNDKVDEVVQILQSIAERTRVKAGCVSCFVHRDTEDENVLLLGEVWRDEKEMNHHLNSEEYQNVLLLMEMCSEKPVVKFDTIKVSSGAETIQAARRGLK